MGQPSSEASDAQTRAVFEHPSLYTLILVAERDRTGQIVDWIYRDANGNASWAVA
jgi:hypothetical protein